VRGLLRYASEDVAAGLLDQVSRWMYEGRLVDSAGNFDYTIALSRATTPLLCVAVPGDVMAPLACATPAVAAWGASDARGLTLPARYGRLAPRLGEDAEQEVFTPVAAWLSERRRLAWNNQGHRMIDVSSALG